MCGIVGYTGARRAVEVLLEGLENLEYRGYDSAGISLATQEGIYTQKAKGRLANLRQRLSTGVPESSCGIGHTRWATHGEPSDINSHPHCSGQVSLVHNGIVENYMELRRQLMDKGHVFLSQTDTETIVQYLDLFYQQYKDPIQAIRQTLALIRGTYALAILFADHPGERYAVRKDSPLIVGVGNGENLVASDIPAILPYTRDYILLEEGDVAKLTGDTVEIYDPDGKLDLPTILHADWDIGAAQKGGYDHFMRKEIDEQPRALESTLSPRIVNGMVDFSIDHIDDAFLSDFRSVQIVACGTAMHAGLIGRHLIEKLARIPVSVEVASEYRYCDPILGKEDLVIIVSQSGETADTLAALRLAKARGARTLAIVNVVGSSIAREAEKVIYTHAGPEIAVASTKAFSVQVGVFYLLAIRLAQLAGQLDAKTCKDMVQALLRIPNDVQQTLQIAADCADAASAIKDASSAFYIGRGLDHCLTMEGSLKLKEISYIHSEAYAAGELKHGTISLITDGVPVIAIATQDALLEKTISNIREIKARGGYVLVICKANTVVPEDAADRILRLPSSVTQDLFAPLPAIVPMQLLAYYAAVQLGCDVDKPRNLAKSVTVE